MRNKPQKPFSRQVSNFRRVCSPGFSRFFRLKARLRTRQSIGGPLARIGHFFLFLHAFRFRGEFEGQGFQAQVAAGI